MSVGRKSVTVYLMRHAESASNIYMSVGENENIKDIEVSDVGKEQIKNVAKIWKDVGFSKVYSSDFKRCIETADGILKCQNREIYEDGGKFKRAEIEIDENLREMDFGKLNTASYWELTTHYFSLNEPYFEWKYPEGDTVLQVGKRMLTFLEKCCTDLLIGEGGNNLNILIVSHRVSIAALLYLLGNQVDGVGVCAWEVENFDWERDVKLMNNTGYYKLEIWGMDGGWGMKVVEKHVISHLEQGGEFETEGGKFEKRRGKKKENEKRLRKRIEEGASEMGMRVLGCTQQ